MSLNLVKKECDNGRVSLCYSLVFSGYQFLWVKGLKNVQKKNINYKSKFLS